ncbi:MAG: ATP-binding protein [Myxococcota bacterium]
MALTDAHFRDNPWWNDRGALNSDAHLRRLESQPLVYRHDVPFELDVDAVYTLRGPRQVGKTTFLKRLVRDLLQDLNIKPRRVLYADIGGAGISDHAEFQAFIRQFIAYVRDRSVDDRLYLLLDEVTDIEDWGVAIRTLHGRGDLENATVIATGSHALDVKRGGEQAPGRRGDVEHWDWIMMPLAFRDYARLHDEDLVAQVPRLESLEPREVYRAAEEVHFVGSQLDELFARYLLTGGFPFAVSAEQEHESVPARVYRIYRDAFRGEIQRAGLEEPYIRELISWAGRKRLAQEFSWRNASDETSIGSKDTARKYLETAQALFLWHIYYRVLDPTKSRAALKSPKKLFPADPFGWHVLESWAVGERDPWAASLARVNNSTTRGDLVESVVADHLRRRFGRFSYYYRSKKGREEIDFALFEDGSPQALIEVKQQSRIRAKHRSALAKHGGGILAVRNTDDLAWHEDDAVAAVPVSYLLAMLPWDLSLFPERE